MWGDGNHFVARIILRTLSSHPHTAALKAKLCLRQDLGGELECGLNACLLRFAEVAGTVGL